jgi:AGCS family alanine or glycine:cation symporter
VEFLDSFLRSFSGFVWGLPLLLLLSGGGLYFLIRSRLLPFRYLGHALQVLRGKYDDPEDPGQISHFQALSTALSATVGMGNISGVAVAIAVGGPGAVFWMWMSAILGMATKYFTSTLAIMYRGKDDAGELQGGPMYFIVEGLGKRWKPMAIFFSICGLVGALPVFNVNQLTQAVNDIMLKPLDVTVSFYSNLGIGLVLVVMTSVVILGGIKRVGQVAEKLVPFMVLLYFLLVGIIILSHFDVLGYYIKLIFTDAFAADYYPQEESFLGGVLGALIIHGIKRGAFSNEAGIGTAPMAHGAAKTDEPVREGLVAMLGPAIDTLVVCTLTALAILVTGVWQTTEANGVSLTANAFEDAMPLIGKYGLLVCIGVFSISSLFSYSYYGAKCMAFLFGVKSKTWYYYAYIISILIGATTSLEMMINLIDGVFALMAIPTMIATIILAPDVLAESQRYFSKYQKPRRK